MRSDIRDTVDWNGKRLAHFNTEKSKIVLVDRPNNSIATDVGMDEFILEINSSFKILGLPFLTELGWVSYIDSIAKTVSKKIEILDSFYDFLFFCGFLHLNRQLTIFIKNFWAPNYDFLKILTPQ